MAEKRVIELDIQTNEKSLKAQLREAQSEVAALSEKFGATSQAAINAAKRAAQLKDAIGDAKTLTDAFNPDAKFKALTQSLSGALNGFQAFEGALGLVGVESEAVQESLLKVQSAMALAQGVDGVLESVDSFKTLGAQVMKFGIVQKVVTAGQWLWNTAMAANPIGALTVAITALIAAGYALVKWFQSSAAESERYNASIKKSTLELKKQNAELEKSATRLQDSNKFQYDYAKAAGASSEELRKLAIKHAEEEFALAKKNRELAKATYLREKDILASMRANDADEEVIKKQSELVKSAAETSKKMGEIQQQEYKELKDLRNQQKIEIKQEETDKINAKKENAKSSVDTQEDGLNAELEQIKEFNKQAKESNAARLRTDQENEEFAVTEKFKAQIALFKKHGKDTTQLETAQANEINDIRLKYKKVVDDAEEAKRQKELEAIKEANRLKVDAENEYLLQIENLQEQNYQNSLTENEREIQAVNDKYFALEEAAKGNAEQEKIIAEAKAKELEDIDKKSKEKQIAAENELRQKRLQLAGQAFTAIGDIISSFTAKNDKDARKQFQIQKAFNLAAAVTNTAMAVTGALTAGGNPIKLATGQQFVEAGIAAAVGAANIIKIASSRFGGGGGGGGSTPSPAGGGGAMAPNFNVVGSSGVNQLAQIQQQPTRAYVVSGDVATGLSLERNRLQNASF